MKKLIMLLLVCVFTMGINAQNEKNNITLNFGGGNSNDNITYFTPSIGYSHEFLDSYYLKFKTGLTFGYMYLSEDFNMGMDNNYTHTKINDMFFKVPLDIVIPIIKQDNNLFRISLICGLNYYYIINENLPKRIPIFSDFNGYTYNTGIEIKGDNISLGIDVEYGGKMNAENREFNMCLLNMKYSFWF